ncbi:hypothetical protein H1Q63_33260 [Desmonostoc muscorum CCALA 125]|uniref:Uncharacterized protein n=1 Tax=Desmonostoc muscorum LEGE 12446 TaxID=1828758 RepID=A0A8J7DHN3_DESMC|nr:DUF6174 domain-containing protein [Desmonostoc muscorum]MBX9258737.1 hypothetical protein [Desmonostoc muscorum CCALA 125]MCF2150617.1 DUF6174 domain-containing protein [Desmonostoc muscorum LEGE 12446]
MRLSIIISVGLLLFPGLNLPVMSQPPIEIAQSAASHNLNNRRLYFNRRLWEKQNISNYRYTFSNGCFCIPDARGPVIIEVRNGKKPLITSVATGQPVENPEFFDKYNTIPKLFNVIQDAINRQASSLDVNYNPKLGYPTQINVDYNAQIADEEIYLTIENFEEIK